MFDQPRYARLCDKYGKAKVDEYLEDYDAYVEAKGKRYKNRVATVQVWMRKNGEQPRPGWGVARPAEPTCKPNHVIKSTHDEALCMTCGRELRLVAGKWVEVGE